MRTQWMTKQAIGMPLFGVEGSLTQGRKVAIARSNGGKNSLKA